MDHLIGQTLGQYTIIEALGHGGMAAVFRARQQSVDREVAIKVLPPYMTAMPGYKERFYSEVDIIAHLQHPHILPVYDFGEQDDLLYIAMALIGGGTLSGLIQQGPVEPSRASAVIRQVASALDYAHGQGIIHRDIKPSNILLDAQGNAYLADFGLAKVADSGGNLTGTGILGTPSYMAPDLADPKTVTSKIDVYGLAVILFELLTGKLPYQSDSALSLIMAHTSQPIPQLRDHNPELPAELQAVLERGMAKNPAERYPLAGALADDLDIALSGREQVEIPVGLIFTDTAGRVIFVDGYFLKMTHRAAGQARAMIGMQAHELLGVGHDVVQKILADISHIGQVRDLEMDIVDSAGKPLHVHLSGTATYDEKGKSIGADLSVRQAAGLGEGAPRPSAPSSIFDTGEREFVHEYLTAQINALRVLLIRMGGQKPADRLENIINETAQRNDWAVEMTASQLVFGPGMRTDVYRALATKAINYAAAMIGKGMVLKQLDAVDQQLGPAGEEIGRELNLREIVAEAGR